MADRTRTQRASQEMAEAVFADSELTEEFKVMAKETETRDPVPDDFSWLSQDARPAEEFSRFKALTQELFRVPREEATKIHRGHTN